MGPIVDHGAAAQRVHVPAPPGPKDVKRAVREFLTTPVDWYRPPGRRRRRAPPGLAVAIDVPTAFVAGRWDVLASHHDMRSAADRIDGATYVELFGTHFITLEKPKAVTRLLHDLVDRTLEASGPRGI